MSVIGRTLRKMFPRKNAHNRPLAIAYGETYMGETFMPTIRELGASGSKISLSWSSLEPLGRKTLPEPYDWHLLDRFTEQLVPGDIALVNLFTDHPIYTMATRPKGSLVHVNYRDKFTAMVKAVVDRCKNRVTFLQCNTEPASSSIHWPSDRADEYCDLYSLLYSAAKDVNPDIKIVGVNCAGHFSKGTPAYANFFKTVIERSPFDYCDCRGYENKYELPMKFKWFRAELESCGKLDVPMICTEYGGPDPREHPLFSKYRAQYPNNLQSVPDTLKMFMSNDPDLINLHEIVHARDVFQRTVILLSDLCKAEYVFYWNLVSGGHHPIFGRMRLCEWGKGPVGLRCQASGIGPLQRHRFEVGPCLINLADLDLEIVRYLKLDPLYQAQSYAAMAEKLAGMEKIEMAAAVSTGRIYYHDGTALDFEWDPNDDFKDTGGIEFTKIQDATR